MMEAAVATVKDAAESRSRSLSSHIAKLVLAKL